MFKKVDFRAPYNFLGFDDKDCRLEDAKAVIIPVPYDSTTSYRSGTREGPAAIIMASRQIELYDLDLQCEPLLGGVHTLQEVSPDMRGPAETIDNVEQAVTAVLNAGKLPVTLGGEHTITIAPVRAVSKKYGKPLSVLQIDAHSDLRDTYEGSKYSHACAMRRIFDLASLTQVGIRNTCADEIDFIKGVSHKGIIWASEMLDEKNAWIDRVIKRLDDNVYITIDVDGLDPSIMPSTGTPEPGGMLWYPTIELLNRVIDEKNVVGFDVVELCPIQGNVAPDFLAAKLVFKILGRIFKKNGWCQ